MVTTYYNNKSLRVADSNYDDIQGDVRTAAIGSILPRADS